MTELEPLHLTAFSDDPEGGNPAGVILDARGKSDDELQAIAAELGYSETAFLYPVADNDAAYAIRYFSPVGEVDFCGHATIAAGVALGREHGDGLFELSSKVGLIPVDVTVVGRQAVATMTTPAASSEPLDEDLLDDLLEALDWEHDDLDPRFVPTIAHAGTFHPVLVADSRARLAELDYDYDDLLELMEVNDWLTIQLVYPKDGDPHQRTWYSRNPAPTIGMYEDAATGTAAAAFGAFLRDYGIAGSGDHITVLQGDEMGRPSSIMVTIGGSTMRVSGTAVDL